MYKVRLVSFLEPLVINTTFSKWPNHITLTPAFKVNDLDELVDRLKGESLSIRRISYRVSSIAYFGLNKDVKVSLLANNNELRSLHGSLLKIVTNFGIKTDMKYAGNNYKPHITHNCAPYPKENDEGFISNISVVRYLDSEKEIVGVIELTKS